MARPADPSRDFEKLITQLNVRHADACNVEIEKPQYNALFDDVERIILAALTPIPIIQTSLPTNLRS